MSIYQITYSLPFQSGILISKGPNFVEEIVADSLADALVLLRKKVGPELQLQRAELR